MRIRAAHYATGERIDLVVEDGEIQFIGPSAQLQPVKADLEADYVAPAFFDIQINGCLGRDFSSTTLTSDDVHVVVNECRNHGIGAFCPTLITNAFVPLQHGLRTIAKAIQSDAKLARAMSAIHLEGPYISSDDGPRGAHPRAHARSPDWDEFQRLQDAANGCIRIVTLAPELDGAVPFIERLAKDGIVAAIGHTAASPQRIREAISAGARMSTHLGNGCHQQLPRHENYLWEQLAADELWASVISDGHHLPAAILRSIVRVKTPGRLIITCDASPFAGLPPGRHQGWGQEIEVEANGRVSLPDQGVLAGSGVFTDTCLGAIMRLAGVSLKDAVDMASVRPRELLGLQPWRIEEGVPANLVVFDLNSEMNLTILGIVVNGELVAHRSSSA